MPVLIAQLYLGLSGPYWAHWATILDSKDKKMSKEGTAGKTKHTII